MDGTTSSLVVNTGVRSSRRSTLATTANWALCTSTASSRHPQPVRAGGDGGADFFLGLDDSYGRGVSTGKTWQQTSNVIGIYAQDTWRVTDRLTLNLGLRYDAHTPWVETHNQQANYNFATGNIDLAGQGRSQPCPVQGNF